MGILRLFILILVVFLIGILDSSVDGYRYFRHGRLGRKIEDPIGLKFTLTQKLDHFNPNDEREWQQIYFVNEELFNTTSRNLAFLEIGGEGQADISWMSSGAWYLYAQDFQPILFQLEHRYYGHSLPTEDASTENLVYLTSQQALADLAFFIEAMNKQYNLSSDVKWILFGGSYAGSLAAWMRQKYPHLVHGAVSSSGPLLAKLNFPEYFQVVQEALRAVSDECANAVQEGTRQIDNLLLDASGQQTLKDKLKLCENIDTNNAQDVSSIYQILADNFASVVQYNHLPYSPSVEKICRYMTDKSLGTELDRLAKVNYYLAPTDCLNFKYDDFVAEYRETSWHGMVTHLGGRQWFYQTCTEFGFFLTSDYKPQIFGDQFDADFFVNQCRDIFGPKFNKTFVEKAVERTNVLYGGMDIDVDNVIFVHGSLDPWHVLGITQSQNSKSPAILIEGAAHCSDIYEPLDTDTPQQNAAKVQIKDFIASLLN